MSADLFPTPTSLPPGPQSAGFTLGVWTGRDLEAGLQDWRALEARLGDVPLACSHLWTASWLRVYGDLVPSTILTGEAHGQTVAAALVTAGVGQKSGPITLRTRHIGTAGEPLGHSVCVEYNGLLAERSARSPFAAAVHQWLRTQRRVDEIRLDGWPREDAVDWNWPDAPHESRVRSCRYFDLGLARLKGVEPIELLGRSTRQNLRRLLRKYGELEMTWAGSLEEADDILAELITLHQARWQSAGQPGAFSSARFEAFQRQLLIQGFDAGKVVLFRVRHQGQTVGCLMLLVDRGRLLDYVSGFADFEVKPSPGLLTHFLCLTEAGRRGYRAYDFLVGDKRHKDNLSTHSQDLVWSTWRRQTMRNTAVEALKCIRRVMRACSQCRPVAPAEQALLPESAANEGAQS
jgi:CelD/BcsL family acetyltransferase involved in cellulose biosynthesis